VSHDKSTMSDHEQPIDDAYFAAVYTFETRGGPMGFRFAGHLRDAAAAAPCPVDLAQPWGMLTAYNPMSEPLPDRDNRERDLRLTRTLNLKHSAAFHRAVACDTTGDWREPGWTIVPIEREVLLGLARRFGQRASVYAEGGKVGLLFTQNERWIVRPLVAVAPVPADMLE
jgi:hypothetical protein